MINKCNTVYIITAFFYCVIYVSSSATILTSETGVIQRIQCLPTILKL